MADDDRPNARDPQVAAWLAVDPLDDLTRRRLVTTALGHRERQPSRAFRWIAAAAAAVVVVAVGALALVTANGGHDEQQAATPARTPERAETLAPESATNGPIAVGDYGDLDRSANLRALRRALETTTRGGSDSSNSKGAPASSADASGGASTSLSALPCSDDLPSGTVVAEGTGTLDGRRAAVVLTRLPDGSSSIDALLADPCEVRHLP